MEIIPYACIWEEFPTSNIITGGISSLSIGSMKRKFKELLYVNHLVFPEQLAYTILHRKKLYNNTIINLKGIYVCCSNLKNTNNAI